jgi:hypothetical protein
MQRIICLYLLICDLSVAPFFASLQATSTEKFGQIAQARKPLESANNWIAVAKITTWSYFYNVFAMHGP